MNESPEYHLQDCDEGFHWWTVKGEHADGTQLLKCKYCGKEELV